MTELLKFKIVLIGESGVGKTCILQRYINDIINPNVMPTIGTTFSTKIIEIKEYNKKIKFELWDTAGQEKYKSLAKIFYRNADVCVFVYDITNKNSFNEIKNFWIKDVKDNIQENSCKEFYNIFKFSLCFGWK